MNGNKIKWNKNPKYKQINRQINNNINNSKSNSNCGSK